MGERGDRTWPMKIVPADLDDPRVRALLAHHHATARAATAPGSAHALDLDELRAREITVWAAWEGDTLVGVGALQRLSREHGEIKSMHTAEACRRRGAGRAMLLHIMAAAMSQSYGWAR